MSQQFRYHAALEPMMVPISAVSQHPENPNVNDLDEVMTIIQHNGFTTPVLAQQSTGYIVDGNHRYQAVIALGAESIPVIWLDIDDEEALRMLVEHNRLARMGKDDDAILASLLDTLQDTEKGLVGTGFTDGYLDYLHTLLEEPLDFDEDEFAKQRKSRDIVCPKCGFEFGGH